MVDTFALFNPFRPLIGHRELIFTFVRKDLVGRYRGSFMGLLWTILNPLFMLVLYSVLFGAVLKVRFSSHGLPANYTLYLLCGMLPWLGVSEAISRSVDCVVGNANLVKKVVFPLEILPVNLVVSALISEGFALIVLLGAIIALRQPLQWTALLLPLVLIPQILLTLGMAWLLASIGVFVRDLGQVVGLMMTAWMFATPIMYPETLIPPRFAFALLVNPMAVLVSGYRGLFLEGRLDHAWILALWALAALALCAAGYAWFVKTRKGFADVV